MMGAILRSEDAGARPEKPSAASVSNKPHTVAQVSLRNVNQAGRDRVSGTSNIGIQQQTSSLSTCHLYHHVCMSPREGVTTAVSYCDFQGVVNAHVPDMMCPHDVMCIQDAYPG